MTARLPSETPGKGSSLGGRERAPGPPACAPFWGAFLIAAGVGAYARDWAECVLAAVASYVLLALLWIVLARVLGWRRRLDPAEFFVSLFIFIGG